jgi:SAM-dependent methyltransferase
MLQSSQKSLSIGHRKAIGLESQKTASSGQVAKRIFKDDRVEPLQDIPPHIIKKAWFTLAHTLLDKGAHVLDVGCTDGAMAYTMAALNPDIKVTGVDINADMISKAQKNYSLPNLSFRVGDIFSNLAPPDSIDVIINSFILHEIYSSSFYNERLIRQALEAQYKALKEHGVIVIRDHLMPTPNEYVLIEFKDTPSTGDDLMSLSEADLLIWYSNMARAKHHPDGAGFFLEELPPNYPRTRLFRLPSKWAWEFFLRKDDPALLEEELAKEYAFYTEQDFRKDLRALGARVSYTAPHWDEGFIQSRFKGHMRLYREDGTPMGPPPTSSIIVAEKIAQKTSQLVQERRTSRARAGSLYVRTVRDDRSGQISDIVSRDLEIAEVIPYRVTPEGVLKVYLHESLPRGLANSVPRIGKNLDGRRWSGHMTEALALPAHDVRQAKEGGGEAVKAFALSKIGIKASLDTSLQDGPGFFPDPYRIDEKIETYFMRVENQQKAFEPKETLYDLSGFSSKGRMRELDAQDVMNALAVGYLPSSRLEVQLLALFELCDIRHQVWVDMPLQLSEVPIEEVVNIEHIKARMTETDKRFRNIRGTAGNIRLVQSVFVDEGRDEGGGITGLAARDMEFIVPENTTLNTAVVLPLVRDLSGEVMAGVVTEYLPVPQRYKDSGLTLTLPSFPLPREITDPEAARLYIAEQFKVEPKFVARMGESYFAHIGITPHRIYPFVVTNIHGVGGSAHFNIHTPLRYLWSLLFWDNHVSFMKIVASAYKRLFNNDQSPRTDFDFSISQILMKSRISESSVLALGNQLPVMSTSSSPTLSEEVNSTSTSGSGKGGNGDKDKMGNSGSVNDVFGEEQKHTNGAPKGFTTPKAPV